jgi:uncharacterized SAM-binding protein YcdF (DUF218 family)
MFFVLSKVLGFFAVPSNFLCLLALAGICLLVAGWRRLGLWLVVGGVVLTAILGFFSIGNILLLPLTERFPAWDVRHGDPDGIVVLGGSIDADVSSVRNSIELDSSSERVLTMAVLARRFPNARVVFSGGSGNLISEAVPEAPYAKMLLAELGMTGDRFIFEDASRTTYENAVYSYDLVKPKPGERWLLVTSASHMPRSVGTFRKVGFEVEAFPVDWQTRGWSDAWQFFRKLSTGLGRTDTAMREWSGLVVYWLTGRTSELFPGPRPSGCDTSAANDACRRR